MFFNERCKVDVLIISLLMFKAQISILPIFFKPALVAKLFYFSKIFDKRFLFLSGIFWNPESFHYFFRKAGHFLCYRNGDKIQNL